MSPKRLTRLLVLFTSCLVILMTVFPASVFAKSTRSTASVSRSASSATIVYNSRPIKAISISTKRPSHTNRIVGNRYPEVIDPSPLPDPVPGAHTPVRVTHSQIAQGFAAIGGLQQQFNGLSNVDSTAVFGQEVTPPDQGLCVGTDPGVSGEVVFEIVNVVVRETAPNGGALPAGSLLGNTDFQLADFFSDPNAFSDPRCFYDSSTHSFYFIVLTTIGFDVAVFNAVGFAVYQFDASSGGQFFPDQPHVGYDKNNLYISTDQFSPGGTLPYVGAALFAISKAQLVAEVANPAGVSFGPLSLAGLPVLTLQPAVSTTSTGIEYLMNSFPVLDSAFDPDPFSAFLGLWTVLNGAAVSTGGTVILTGRIIPSESYVFPIPALSTGDGSSTGGITSETSLNPDDDRLQQVQFVNGQLWAALTTAVIVGFDPTPRDGVAWFRVDPVHARVISQGYIAASGQYLIYPAIMHNAARGTTAIVFTITSPGLNPSAAYVVSPLNGMPFGPVRIAGQGTDPHVSFAHRWGDYSAATLDLNSRDIWLATEYIPPLSSQDPVDNWGTFIMDVQGI